MSFSHFSGVLHHFVLAKLATSSIRVNKTHTLFSEPNLRCLKWSSSGQAGSDPSAPVSI